MHLCHWNVIWSNIFMRSTKTSFAIAAVVHIDHVPKVVNIGPRCVDNLSFQPQIDTDLRFNIHVWYESNNIWTNNEILLRLKKKKTIKQSQNGGDSQKQHFVAANLWQDFENGSKTCRSMVRRIFLDYTIDFLTQHRPRMHQSALSVCIFVEKEPGLKR